MFRRTSYALGDELAIPINVSLVGPTLTPSDTMSWTGPAREYIDGYSFSMMIIGVVGVFAAIAFVWEFGRRAKLAGCTLSQFVGTSMADPAVQLKAMYCGAFFAMGNGVGIVGPSVPYFTSLTSTTVGQVAGILSLRAVGWCAVSTGVAPLLDCVKNPHHIFVVTIGTVCVAHIFAPLFSNVIIFTVLQLIAGGSVGATDSCGNTLLLRACTSDKDTDVWMQTLHATFAVGSVVGAAVVSGCNAVFSAPVAAVLSHLFVSVAHVFVFCHLLISPPPAPPKGSPTGSPTSSNPSSPDPSPTIAQSLKVGMGGDGGTVATTDEGRHSSAAAHAGPSSPTASGETPADLDAFPAPTPSPIRTTPRIAFALLLSLFLFFYVGLEMSLLTWLTSMGITAGFAKPAALGLTVVFAAAFAVGRVGSIVVSAHVAPKWLLAGDLTLASCVLAIFWAFPWGGWSLWMMALMCGLAFASAYASGYALASRYVEVSGVVVALVQFFAAGGEFVVSAATGIVLDQGSLPAVGWWLLACCGLAVGTLGLLIFFGHLVTSRSGAGRVGGGETCEKGGVSYSLVADGEGGEGGEGEGEEVVGVGAGEGKGWVSVPTDARLQV